MRVVTRKNLESVLAIMLAAAVAFSFSERATAAGDGYGWMVAQQNQQQQNQQQGQQQNRQDQGQQEQKQSANMQQHFLASDVIGLDVYNDRNEELGKINDVVFDRQRQRVSHAVLSRGGFIGIGEDLYPIPWEEVTPQFAQNRVLVPITKSVLENTEPMDERVSELRRVSELTGMKVQFAGGAPPTRERDRDESFGERIGISGADQAAGELDDILLTMDGRPVFALIQPNTEILRQIEEHEIVAVPWTKIEVMAQEKRMRADITQSEAQQLTVSQYELARLDQQSFGRQLYGAVGEQMPAAGQTRQSGQQPRQAGQTEDMQKWSDFTQQCLGPNMNRANQTVEGTVENVGTLYTSPEAEAPDGLRFVVTTNQNEQITVYAGPRGEVSQQLNLNNGDQVTIRGTECEIENEQVFVATSIQSNGDQFELTQKNGAPQWESKSKQNQQNKQNQQKQQKQGGQPR